MILFFLLHTQAYNMRQKTFVLAKAILERKDILFGPIENVVKPQAMKDKEDAWEAVRTEMIEQGFINFERKSWRDVRNHDWQYLRRSAVAKYEHNQKAGVEIIHYNEVDRLVFEIMGNEASVYENLNNDPIYLGNTSIDEEQQNEGTDFFLTLGTNTSRKPKLDEQKHQQQQNTITSQTTVAGCGDPAQLMRLVETKSVLDSAGQNSKSKDVLFTSNLPSAGSEIQSDLLQSLISSSSFINYSDHNDVTPPHPSFSQPVISTVSARKRPHSCSSASAKSTEDEVVEAKLRLLMIQIRREEIIMQQETYKLAQEEAKLRQERAKAELLEMQLRTERAKSNGVTL